VTENEKFSKFLNSLTKDISHETAGICFFAGRKNVNPSLKSKSLSHKNRISGLNFICNGYRANAAPRGENIRLNFGLSAKKPMTLNADFIIIANATQKFAIISPVVSKI
jgi:hypothetical protein